MKKRLLILIFFWHQSLAVNCYITFMKGDCWKNYDVTITAFHGTEQTEIASVELKKDKLWKRVQFSCAEKDAIDFKATFTPAIWKNTKASTYHSKSFIYTPAELNKDTTAWEIPICFATGFSGAPIPPTAIDTCGCNIQNEIPAIAEKIRTIDNSDGLDDKSTDG